jgi:MFS family permease
MVKLPSRIRRVYDEYPRQFWVLILGVFIDRLGGALIFPFLTLYITKKFNVGMTEVGLTFALFAVANVVGSMLGGALTDRFGRKGMLIIGLLISGLSSLAMGLAGTFEFFFGVVIFVGMLANIGGPAQQAMVADLLPEEKRAEGFGILRVVVNLAVAIGPAIGGLVATSSYLLLFISDAVSSTITAAIVTLAIRETRPVPREGQTEETITQTFAGYRDVLRDLMFVFFIGACMLMAMVYMQMNTTLAVYLRDVHGVTERGFGYILSLNAAMVVLFQFPITRWIRRYQPLLVMAAGTLLYAVGFGLYGLVSAYSLFLLAMVIITIGEMFVSPTSQALVAQLAPEDMRGRYMAIFGFSWVVPSIVGPLLAGLVMDNANPHWVWYGAGLVGLAATGAFVLLRLRVERGAEMVIDGRLSVLERLERGEISAAEAANLLEMLRDSGQWAGAGPPGPRRRMRRVHLRVSDRHSGATRMRLVLPMGLMHTVFDVGGRLGAGLEGVNVDDLKALVTRSAANGSVERLDTQGDEQVEIKVE